MKTKWLQEKSARNRKKGESEGKEVISVVALEEETVWRV